MPPSRQAVVAPSLALHADDVAPEIAGALAAQGLHPAEQTSLGWLHRRRAESDAGNAIKLPKWYASVGPRSSRRWRRFADHRRGKASLRCRKMQPQNSPLRAGRAIYSFSPHKATKQLCLRVGMRRKRSVHSRRLSRRILALTLQLTILRAQ
jgi:hypothetical protein